MDILKKMIEKIIFRFPMKNMIILESLPDFSDNTRAVFDEMLARGMNRQYRLVWTTHEKAPLPAELSKIKNVKAVQMDSVLYKYYYSYFAKALLVGNFFMQRRRREQYYMYLAHGAAYKAIKDHRYTVPKDCYGCDFCTLSKWLGIYDVRNLNVDETQVNICDLGYARNDTLQTTTIDRHRVFSDRHFEKLLYWMPTFRQKAADNGKKTARYSSTAIPFLDNGESAAIINSAAKKNETLLVVKPHPAQDMSAVKQLQLSNIIFIDNRFLEEHAITNYDLLGASDALLSDYSSVYYDYLLCDKPIGLCWEDFEEYSQNEGFYDDPMVITRGGEKLWHAEDLCRFIADVRSGKDTLQDVRREQAKQVHSHLDSHAAKRIVDRIISQIEPIS